MLLGRVLGCVGLFRPVLRTHFPPITQTVSYSKYMKERSHARTRVKLDHLEPASKSPVLREKFANMTRKENEEDGSEEDDIEELEKELVDPSQEEIKKQLIEDGVEEEHADQLTSNEFKELVDRL